MNKQLEAIIILMDNLLYNPVKFSRETFKEELKDLGLSCDDSFVTRVVKTGL